MTEASTPPKQGVDPLTGQPFTAHDTVDARVKSALHAAVRTVAARQSGAGAFVEKLCEGDPRPAQLLRPEPAIAATAALRDEIERALYYPIRKARAGGTSWARLGELLGVTADGGGDALARVYALVGPVEGLRPQRGEHLTYDCGDCRQTITDFGPFESDPDDNEKGHASNCVRHQRAVAEWRAKHAG